MKTKKSRAEKTKRLDKTKLPFAAYCSQVKGLRSRLNYLSIKSGSKEWVVMRPPRCGPPVKAVNIRESKKWATDQEFVRAPAGLPLLDEVGKYTGSVSYIVDIHPAAYIGSVVSTVYTRLRAFTRRHNKSERNFDNKWKNLLLRASAYYALTKNSYFWDRVLACVRHRTNRRRISGMIHYFSHKLDDYKWFLYSQCCLQTNWLTFRANRPRDKSSLERSFKHRSPARDSAFDRTRRFEYDAIWACYTSMSGFASF